MEKIKLAIVGIGAIAFVHARGLERVDGAELVAICDVDDFDLDI